MTSSEEFGQRLADIRSGPWANGADFARNFFAPRADLDQLARAEEVIGPDDIERALGPADDARQHELATLLRPHWERDIGPDEVRPRDSLDDLLEMLLLIELALETGYLALDYVRLPVRAELLRVAWARGVRAFLLTYGYIGIELLAARVGIQLGLADLDPPQPDTAGAMRFATFLSQHAELRGDVNTGLWLSILDEYHFGGGETDWQTLETYLRGGRLPTDTGRVGDLLPSMAAGYYQFLVQLADLFAILQDAERPRFGLIYLYWMTRFFGYRLTASGIQRGGIDWSRVVVEAQDGKGPFESDAWALLRESVASVRLAWVETSQFVAELLPGFAPHADEL